MFGFLDDQYFKHKINLIELTKILERVPCDSLSFSHKLRTASFDSQAYVDYTASAWEEDSITGEKIRDMSTSQFNFHSEDLSTFYLSPSNRGTFRPLFIPIYIITGFNSEFYLKVKDERNNVIFNNRIKGASGTVDYWNTSAYTSDFRQNIYLYSNSQQISIDFPSDSYYTFEYLFKADGGGTSYYCLKIEFVVQLLAAGIIESRIPTITEVINRILDVGSPRLATKSPKYTLDPIIAEKFSNTPAPEFFMSRMTLFEALMEVGKKIHGIPRLTIDSSTNKPTLITYDLLGLDEEYTIPQSAKIIGYKKSVAIDDYCGCLDSYAENHINTIDPNAGTITEPFDGGFKTLVCESGVKISDQTAVFETTKPIYRIIKVEMAFTSTSGVYAGTQLVERRIIGDITKYCYEQAEYDGLYADSTVGFPDSMAFALVWKQGDKYIRGFNGTSVAIINFLQNFEPQAINNIVRDVNASKPSGDITEYSIPESEYYGDLAFRVTYIPMDNIRLRQYKPYNTHPNGNVLYNQQSANTVEGSYYGTMLKGKIARMGNDIEIYSVRYNSPDDLPKIGNVLMNDDDEAQGYVYKITTANGRNYTKADIYITKDFNRLSSYFSLESNFRLFEVSERQSIDRQIIVPRVIKIRTSNTLLSEPSMFGATIGDDYVSAPIQQFMDTFLAGTPTWASRYTGNKRITVAAVRLLSKSYEQIGSNAYALPVNSTACGNSLAFSFSFKDSFSAGTRSAASAYSWRQRKEIPYGNAFGEFYAMEFGLCDTIYEQNLSVFGEEKKYEHKYDYQTNGFCDNLPIIHMGVFEMSMKGALISTKTLYGWGRSELPNTTIRAVDKNSSEHISVTVQFSGQATDEKIVIGSAMWNNNLLIRDDPVPYYDSASQSWKRSPHVFVLENKRLNMLREAIDISDPNTYDLGALQEVVINEYNGRYYARLNRMQLNMTPNKIKAWCIADSETGEIYIGMNEEVQRGGYTSNIYFTFDEEA